MMNMTNVESVNNKHSNDQYGSSRLANLQYGQVYAVNEASYAVTTMDESWWLSLAASCVLIPNIGDTVLFTHTNNDGYILAILQSADSATDSQLNLPENTNIKVKSLAVNADLLHTQGQTNISVWQQQTQITQDYRQFSNRINVQADSRQTKINGHDELQAQSKRIVIVRDWRVRAQDADIRAKRQASIDGERVRLG